MMGHRGIATLFLSLAAFLLFGCSRGRTPGTAPSLPPSPAPGGSAGPGGTVVGGGIDDEASDHGSAWFLGDDKKITYCLEVSPSFGAQRVLLIAEIESAFAKWRAYAKAKLVTGIAMTPHYSSVCDGTQDLVFYFGVTTREVDAFRSRFDRPIAFAGRTLYSAEAGWGRGFIWLASAFSVSDQMHSPDWDRPGALTSAILHELGHVFGNGHVRGTVMDPSLSFGLIQGSSLVSEIDITRELYVCSDCRYTYRAVAWGKTGLDAPISPTVRDQFLRRFTGRDLRGEEVIVRLVKDRQYWHLQFSVESGKNPLDATVPLSASELHFGSGAEIFKKFARGFLTFGWDHAGVIKITARDSSGQKVFLLMENNAGGYLDVAGLPQAGNGNHPQLSWVQDGEEQPVVTFSLESLYTYGRDTAGARFPFE